MYCAFLRIGDKWTKSHGTDEILNHDGECVICDTWEDAEQIGLTLAGMEPERHVTKQCSYYDSIWYVTDHPYFENLTDAAEAALAENEVILVKDHDFVHCSHKGRVFYIAGINSTRRDGLIAERDDDDDLWKVTINLDLWTIGNKKVDNLRKKRVVAKETARVTYPELQKLGSQLISNAGFQAGNDGAKNIISGIILMDELYGKEATNEHITELAAKWLKYKLDNTAKFLANWLTQEDLERLNKRFEEIHPPKKETIEENVTETVTAA